MAADSRSCDVTGSKPFHLFPISSAGDFRLLASTIMILFGSGCRFRFQSAFDSYSIASEAFSEHCSQLLLLLSGVKFKVL
ncbi:hypothetical protein LINGRAHAP2_LOCUS25535 [Linum grandiflorum]